MSQQQILRLVDNDDWTAVKKILDDVSQRTKRTRPIHLENSIFISF